MPCPVLSAGSIRRAGCQHSTFPAPSFPWTHTPNGYHYPKPGEAGASKGWETWEHGIKGRRTSSSIPQEQTDAAGSDGTQQTLQEHPPGLLQSQQSLLDIRHPQKTSLETKPNRFAPALPKLWGVPQEQLRCAGAGPGFSTLPAGPRGRRWEEEPTGSPVLPTSSPGGLQEANFD